MSKIPEREYFYDDSGEEYGFEFPKQSTLQKLGDAATSLFGAAKNISEAYIDNKDVIDNIVGDLDQLDTRKAENGPKRKLVINALVFTALMLSGPKDKDNITPDNIT